MKVVYQTGSARRPKVHSSGVIRGCFQRYGEGVGKSACESSSWEGKGTRLPVCRGCVGARAVGGSALTPARLL